MNGVFAENVVVPYFSSITRRNNLSRPLFNRNAPFSFEASGHVTPVRHVNMTCKYEKVFNDMINLEMNPSEKPPNESIKTF